MSLTLTQTISHNLKKIRTERRITQQALAKQAFLSKQTISNLEKGEGATLKTLECIAECLEVSPLEFFRPINTPEDIQLKRVSHKTAYSPIKKGYIEELEETLNKILSDSRYNIFYTKVSPTLKNFFKENADTILKHLYLENNSENLNVLYSIEDTLLTSLKESIILENN